MTLPALMSFTGDWDSYEALLYNVFVNEIAHGNLLFRGEKVSCRRLPEDRGRWASFWHLIQEGPIEEDRLPDLRRCERIRWIKYVIENWNVDPAIDWWENQRSGGSNVLLWLNETYLVILARRDGYWLLKSAYETAQAYRVKSLRSERDRFHGH